MYDDKHLVKPEGECPTYRKVCEDLFVIWTFVWMRELDNKYYDIEKLKAIAKWLLRRMMKVSWIARRINQQVLQKNEVINDNNKPEAA